MSAAIVVHEREMKFYAVFVKCCEKHTFPIREIFTLTKWKRKELSTIHSMTDVISPSEIIFLSESSCSVQI